MKAWGTLWLHRLGSPKWFYQVTEGWERVLATVSCVLLPAGTVWGLLYAPADYLQGNSYRIIFVHVPASFLAQSIYLCMAIAGLIYCVWKIKLADYVIRASAPIGAVMTLLALVSGAIWARPTWGTWWQWDARITTMFILLLLFLGIIILRYAIENKRSAAFACALLAIFGVINIPLIKYSVDWWFTLHQPATLRLTEKPAIDISMLIPLLIMILGFYCFFGWCLLLRLRSMILSNTAQPSWYT